MIFYIFLFLILGFVLWCIYWFIRTAIRSPKETFVVTTLLVCSLGLYLYDFQKKLNRSYVPKVFKVSKVLYTSEKSWGFGPGGNETGIIVYDLPDSTARQISQSGLNYLSSLIPQGDYSNDWRGHYSKWYETPIPFNREEWGSPDSNKDDGVDFMPKIRTYLLRYGFPIPVDSEVENMVDKAITESGSYYAYGRIGLIILIPKAHRVIYAYHG
jgi:hypothetical protein